MLNTTDDADLTITDYTASSAMADHSLYTSRSPSHSDSGVSSVDAPSTPPLSDSQVDLSPRYTDSLSDDQQLSPLGTGVEELEMKSMDYETIDSSWLGDEDLLTTLAKQVDIPIDMGMYMDVYSMQLFLN